MHYTKGMDVMRSCEHTWYTKWAKTWLLCALLVPALCACGTSKKTMNAYRLGITQDVYANQIEMYGILEQTFNELGREYFVLQQEYEDLGRDGLAALAKRRADTFHQRHQQVQDKKNDLKSRLNTLKQSQTKSGAAPKPRKRAQRVPGRPRTPAAPR